jgi:competence protein ComGF
MAEVLAANPVGDTLVVPLYLLLILSILALLIIDYLLEKNIFAYKQNKKENKFICFCLNEVQNKDIADE